jgi:hypothetical protein
MKDLKVMRVTFDMRLDTRGISAFRGAIAHKVGLEHEWFHNHNNNENSPHRLHYRYPLIQYKVYRGCPMIVFLNECTEEAHRLFAQSDWQITFQGKQLDLRIKDLEIKTYEADVFDEYFVYSLQNWMPLTQDNTKAYNKMDRLVDRIEFLERKLNNHLVAFSKGINRERGKRIEAYITHIDQAFSLHFKEQRHKGFDLEFKTNFYLPDFIGLGKGKSLGNGTVQALK